MRRTSKGPALRWAFRRLAPPPLPRQFDFATAAILPDDTLVVFGGEDELLPDITSDEVFTMSTRCGESPSVWDGPLEAVRPAESVGPQKPAPRVATACCVIGQALVIFGGADQHCVAAQESSTVFYRDLWTLQLVRTSSGSSKRQAQWTRLDFSSRLSPPKRAYAAMAALDPRRALLHGGQARHGEYLSDLWLLTLDLPHKTCVAELVEQPKLVPRMSHTMHVLGSLVLIVGGADRLWEYWDMSSDTVLTGLLDLPFAGPARMAEWRVADCMGTPRDCHFSFVLLGGGHLIVGAGDSGTQRGHGPCGSVLDIELFYRE